MMRFMHLKSHWSPEDAHSMLSLLDELRDAIWQAYGDEIIEHCRQQQSKPPDDIEYSFECDDDIVPF